jgi:hypothetical protein
MVSASSCFIVQIVPRVIGMRISNMAAFSCRRSAQIADYTAAHWSMQDEEMPELADKDV